MKHIFFIIHILAFLIGFLSIALSLLLYKRKAAFAAKYYSLFMLSLTMVLFEQTAATYLNVNNAGNDYTAAILKILACIGCALTIYYTPVFIHEFLSYRPEAKRRYALGLLACIPLISTFFYFIFNKYYLISIGSLALLLSVLYTLILVYCRLKDLDAGKKRIVKAFTLLSVIFLPYLSLDIVIERIPGIGPAFPYGILSLPLFYAIWNLISIYFGYREFARILDSGTEAQSDGDLTGEESIDAFCRRFSVTSREKEVIRLLVKGYSYNKISEELTISLSTTKSHIYNIYQKSGVGNKIELLYLIKSSEQKE